MDDSSAGRLRRHHACQTLLSSGSEKSICAPADCAQQGIRTPILQFSQGFHRRLLHKEIRVMFHHVNQAGDCRSNRVLANEPTNANPGFRQGVFECGNKFFFVGARVRALVGSTVRTLVDACIKFSPTMSTKGNHGITPGREWLWI
jgi:hypothetical protein